MKKFMLSALLGAALATCFMAGLASADPRYRATSDSLWQPGTSVVKVFDSYSTVGTGIPIPPDFLADQGSWQIVVNGSPSAYEIAVEGSLIGVAGPYEPMSVIDESTVKLRHWDAKAVVFSQVIVNSMTGNGSFDLYFIKRGN